MGTHPIFESDFDCLTEPHITVMFTTKDVNRQRVREQDYQQARNDFDKSSRHDLMVKNMMDSEDRTMQKRWMQQRYEEQMEQQRIEHLIETQRQKEERVKREEQEEILAKELRRLKLEKLRDEKLRQKVRLESEELRALESKLNAAYATKEREAQIREREVAIQAEIEADLYRQAETERELEASHRAAEKSELAKIEAAKELQKDIQQQLIQKEQEKEFAYQQFLKEKLMIDEVVRKIYEEDARVRQKEM